MAADVKDSIRYAVQPSLLALYALFVVGHLLTQFPVPGFWDPARSVLRSVLSAVGLAIMGVSVVAIFHQVASDGDRGRSTSGL